MAFSGILSLVKINMQPDGRSFKEDASLQRSPYHVLCLLVAVNR